MRGIWTIQADGTNRMPNLRGYKNYAIAHKLWTECGYDRAIHEADCEYMPEENRKKKTRCRHLGYNKFCLSLKAQSEARK